MYKYGYYALFYVRRGGMDTRLTFLTDYVQVKGFSKGVVSLLNELLKVMNADGKIIVNAALKREISSKIQITVGSIDNLILKMNDEGLLHRIDRGMYEPIYELKQAVQQSDAIEMTIVYTDVGKQIMITGGNNK